MTIHLPFTGLQVSEAMGLQKITSPYDREEVKVDAINTVRNEAKESESRPI